jgi:adenylate cyclase
MHQHLQAEIGDWIVTHSLAGDTDEAIVAGVCTRLAAAGLPMLRVAVTSDLLDPTDDARGVRWRRDEGAVEDRARPRRRRQRAMAAQPVLPPDRTRAASLRRRLDAAIAAASFRCSTRCRSRAAPTTWRSSAGSERERLGDMEGVIASWATDAPGGYGEAELGLLAAIMRPLALAFMLASAQRTARTIVATYLGDAAAERILVGNIVRGRAEPLHAVVWFSDLVGFTRLSAAMRPEDVLALLNEYAEAQVESIEGHAGHVLKFMGDGILAIFPDDDPARACVRALDAAMVQAERIAALNERRSAAALPVTARTSRCTSASCSTATSAARGGSTSRCSAPPSTRSPASRRCAARSTRRSSCRRRSPRPPAKRAPGW